MKKSSITGAVLMTLLSTLPLFALPPSLPKLAAVDFKPPKGDRFVLGNGLVVFLMKDATLPIVHLTAFTKTGKIYDPADKIGLGELTAAITCPVLALVGEREGAEPKAQFDTLVAGVTGPVTSRVFRPSDGASTHCQSDNLRLSAQITFDWLDAQLA